MKRIILFICLIISINANAQTAGSPLGNATSYVPVKGGMKFDSGLYIPKKYPSSYHAIDSQGLFWLDIPTKHLWYHNGTTRKETVPKSYVDSAVASSSGSLSIGSAISGGGANKYLYSDASGNLAQTSSIEFTSNISGDAIVALHNGNLATQFSTGFLGTKSDDGNTGVEIVTTSDGVENYIGYHQGLGSALFLKSVINGSKTQTFQNDTGFIALAKNLPVMGSFTASGVGGVTTYTTTITTGYSLSIVQSTDSAQAVVSSSSITGPVLRVKCSFVNTGSSNLHFIFFIH